MLMEEFLFILSFPKYFTAAMITPMIPTAISSRRYFFMYDLPCFFFILVDFAFSEVLIFSIFFELRPFSPDIYLRFLSCFILLILITLYG